jgi:hypothetical protein
VVLIIYYGKISVGIWTYRGWGLLIATVLLKVAAYWWQLEAHKSM